MPEDNKKEMYDAIVKSHHKMITKMYEDVVEPILDRMYHDDDLSDNGELSFYADQISEGLKKVGKIVNSGDKH